jgi:ATP-dependent Clp protease ATP-binding subunit ClpA
VVTFAGLSPEIVAQVVEKFVMQLEAQLADRNVTIELSSAAKEWLSERGYDPLYGARPLARVIQEHIKKPLADEILFGRLLRGGTVRVMLNADKTALTFDIIEAPPMPTPASDEDDVDGGGTSEPQEPELVK